MTPSMATIASMTRDERASHVEELLRQLDSREEWTNERTTTTAREAKASTRGRPRYLDYDVQRKVSIALARGGKDDDGRRRLQKRNARGERGGKEREEVGKRHSLERARANARERETREMTFTPRVRAAKGGGRGKERLVDLAKPRTETWARAAALKAAKEAEAFAEHCTFAPKTGRRPKETDEAPASERLLAYAEKRAERLERAQARVVALEMEDLTFQPKTLVKSRMSAGEPAAPLHERVNDVLQSKQDAVRKAEAKVAEELSAKYTFKPEINPTSAALARQRAESDQASGGDGVPSRRRARVAPRDDDEELTFAPKIAPNSERVFERLARQGKVGAGFLERQREYVEKCHRRIEEQRAQEDDECTFTPDTGSAANILRKSKHVRELLEKPDERAARLAFTDAERKRMTQRVLEYRHYEQFTHEPELNEKSRKLAPIGTSLDDLVHDERRDLAMKRAQAQLEREFREEYTFAPNLDRSIEARRARSQGTFAMDYGLGGDVLSARIEAYQREKEEALETLRKRSANREMEECTFEPITSAQAPRSMRAPSNAKIKGLDVFLEKQSKARQLEAEKRERYAKVFLEDLDDFDRKGWRTIPEPFAVAENVDEKAEVRHQMLAEARLARQLEECTFAPKTNVAS